MNGLRTLVAGVAGQLANGASLASAGALLGIAGLVMAQAAFAALTLPDVGIDLTEDYATILAGITGVIAVAVGGMFAFKLLRKGIKWVSRAIG